MTRSPSVIIYGPPGTGKSTEAAVTFQDCMFITSNPGALWPYEDLQRLKPDLNLKRVSYAPSPLRLPREVKDWNPEEEIRCILIPEAVMAIQEQNGRKVAVEMNFHNWQRMSQILDMYTVQVLEGTAKSQGIVFDEWSEFAARFLRDLENVGVDPSAPKPFGTSWGKWSPLYEYHRKLVNTRQKQLNVPFVFIAHHQPPEVDGGEIMLKGGPNMPSKKLVKIFCASVDAVLQRGIERINGKANGDLDLLTPDDGEEEQIDMSKVSTYGVPTNVQRFYYTETDPYWERKIRSFGLAPKETRDLRTLLREARFVA